MARIAGYTHCRVCSTSSLAYLTNGRLVRHEPGLGSVFPKKWYDKHPGFRRTICKGSGMLVEKPGQPELRRRR